MTDLVTSVPTAPPAILAANDVRALLYHARDDASQLPVDTQEMREVGWQKICLFALYFQSSPLQVTRLDSTRLDSTRLVSTRLDSTRPILFASSPPRLPPPSSPAHPAYSSLPFTYVLTYVLTYLLR